MTPTYSAGNTSGLSDEGLKRAKKQAMSHARQAFRENRDAISSINKAITEINKVERLGFEVSSILSFLDSANTALGNVRSQIQGLQSHLDQDQAADILDQADYGIIEASKELNKV